VAVNLIDRDAVRFLDGFEIARAKLAKSPRYIPEMDSPMTESTDKPVEQE
jgi:hypothetical protein